MIEFNCDSCQATIKVAETAAGKKGKCNKCGAVLLVPQATPPSTAEPTTQEAAKQIEVKKTPPSRRLLLVACTSSLLVGTVIGTAIVAVLNPAIVASFFADPVADFQEHASAEINRAASPVIYPKATVTFEDGWTFNVQRTDSLVSPLTGTCDVKFTVAATPVEEMKLYYDVEAVMTCAFQDGKWVTKSVFGKFKNVSATSTKGGKDWGLSWTCEEAIRRMRGNSFTTENLEGFWSEPLFDKVIVPPRSWPGQQ